MNLAEEMPVSRVREKVTEAEWEARVNLAAAYRLVALYGWDDLVFTHISIRVPGAKHHFLINPYGMLFEEITASSLVKVDINGNIVMDTPLPDLSSWFRHSQRYPCSARECEMRATYPQRKRDSGVRTTERGVTDIAAICLRALLARLPRLRGVRSERRRKAATGS